MEILSVNLKNPERQAIKEAWRVLRSGGTVVVPTDTVYGLAANAFLESAVRRVFNIKKRPSSKALPLMVRDLDMALQVVYANDKISKIMETVWPGQVFLVLEKRIVVPSAVTGGGNTVALRIPDCFLCWALMSELDFPVVLTSANLSGEEPFVSGQAAYNFFIHTYPRPDLILDVGRLEASKPSTVLDLTSSKPKILRVGPVTPQELLKLTEI